MRIFLGIVSAVVFVSMATATVLSLVAGRPLPTIGFATLTALLGVFIYQDYQYYLG